MNHFGDRLIRESIRKESALVVGLDPDIAFIPKIFFKGEKLEKETIAEVILEFNKLVIDTVHPHVAAIKPQLAYYEVYGSVGIQVLEQTIQYAKSKGLLVINDAKRGDIGPTASAYAKAFLGESSISGDAVTVNPFLGRDGIIPFLKQGMEHGGGLFVLLKTSNPSAYELQDAELRTGESLYYKIALLIKEWSKGTIGDYGFSNVGAVVGATYPNVAKQMRELLPETIFLVPGYGAQGGELTTLTNYFNTDGNGAIVSSTRGITYSYTQEFPDTWQDLQLNDIQGIIEHTTICAKNDINTIR